LASKTKPPATGLLRTEREIRVKKEGDLVLEFFKVTICMIENGR
jgi:hypothetical protein